VYCNDQFIELETLGALLVMQPGQTVTHTETWQIYTGVKFPPSLDGVTRHGQGLRIVGISWFGTPLLPPLSQHARIILAKILM